MQMDSVESRSVGGLMYMRSKDNTMGVVPTEAAAVDKIMRAVAMLPSDVPKLAGLAV